MKLYINIHAMCRYTLTNTSFYLEESWEHMEGVNSRRPIRVRQHLVDMATPGILLIIIGYGLECCQNSRKKRRRRWRSLEFRIAVCIALILTVNRDAKSKTQTRIETRAPTQRITSSFTKEKRKQRHAVLSIKLSLLSLSLSPRLTADVLCCSAVTVQTYCRGTEKQHTDTYRPVGPKSLTKQTE